MRKIREGLEDWQVNEAVRKEIELALQNSIDGIVLYSHFNDNIVCMVAIAKDEPKVEAIKGLFTINLSSVSGDVKYIGQTAIGRGFYAGVLDEQLVRQLEDQQNLCFIECPYIKASQPGRKRYHPRIDEEVLKEAVDVAQFSNR